MTQFKAHTITIIGSMKFYTDMIDKAEELHQKGCIVLLPFKCPKEVELTEDLKRSYDFSIRAQIDMSDEILVFNKNKYIGNSTRTELNYAISKGKIISYLEDDDLIKNKIVALIGPSKFVNTINAVANHFLLMGVSAIRPLTFDVIPPENFECFDVDDINEIHNAQYRIIAMADIIGVIDVGGYIGEDTKREIEYAKSINKKIVYYSKGEILDV